MQKPSKIGHADSYVKLLWYCQLQGARKPSDLPKNWILKALEFFCCIEILWFMSSSICKIKIKKETKELLFCKYWSWDYYFLRLIQVLGLYEVLLYQQRKRNSNMMTFDPAKERNIAQQRDHLMFKPSDPPGKAL